MSPPSTSPEHRSPMVEREELYPHNDPHLTAFSPRPETRLATAKSPTTDTKICLNHKLRTFRNESTIIYPLESYQTWVDAGNLEPLYPANPDPCYNANVWRNFSSREGSHYSPGSRGTSATLASMYPLNIPPPSRMGNFTYARFIKYGDIFRDPLRKQKKITWSEKELEEMRRMKMMSDARVPPTDDKGRILPPLAFRRLKAQGRIRHQPMSLDNRYENPPQRMDASRDQHSDTASLASRNTSLRHKGLLWKFSYKMNNPEYDRVVEAQKEKERWRKENTRIRGIRKQALQQELLASY
uniref:Uncharacterized protein ENSP00000372125 homolog n=1 Tax=Phallusia mammillata TaxID=59560 RepID=A0A6F9DV71_9ASCI|nr:uncharacterized protein ENSP00000372125 homolog [Phallusia mammillata]